MYVLLVTASRNTGKELEYWTRDIAYTWKEHFYTFMFVTTNYSVQQFSLLLNTEPNLEPDLEAAGGLFPLHLFIELQIHSGSQKCSVNSEPNMLVQAFFCTWVCTVSLFTQSGTQIPYDCSPLHGSLLVTRNFSFFSFYDCLQKPCRRINKLHSKFSWDQARLELKGLSSALTVRRPAQSSKTSHPSLLVCETILSFNPLGEVLTSS